LGAVTAALDPLETVTQASGTAEPAEDEGDEEREVIEFMLD